MQPAASRTCGKYLSFVIVCLTLQCTPTPNSRDKMHFAFENPLLRTLCLHTFSCGSKSKKHQFVSVPRLCANTVQIYFHQRTWLRQMYPIAVALLYFVIRHVTPALPAVANCYVLEVFDFRVEKAWCWTSSELVNEYTYSSNAFCSSQFKPVPRTTVKIPNLLWLEFGFFAFVLGLFHAIQHDWFRMRFVAERQFDYWHDDFMHRTACVRKNQHRKRPRPVSDTIGFDKMLWACRAFL